MHCARHRDYHSLGLTSNQYHPPKVTPLTNPTKITDQGLCYCNPDAWGWHNSHQSGVISITDQLMLLRLSALTGGQANYSQIITNQNIFTFHSIYDYFAFLINDIQPKYLIFFIISPTIYLSPSHKHNTSRHKTNSNFKTLLFNHSETQNC